MRWLIILGLGVLSSQLQAGELHQKPDFNRIVEAVYKAEGGEKAKYLYGIVSVKYSSREEARRICYNTVKNNYRRWINSGHKGDFIKFLANRYAPIGADNDPRGLNANWYRNVKKLMARSNEVCSR